MKKTYYPWAVSFIGKADGAYIAVVQIKYIPFILWDFMYQNILKMILSLAGPNLW